MISNGATPYDFQSPRSHWGQSNPDTLGRIRDHYRSNPASELLVTITVDQIAATKEFQPQFAKLKSSLLAGNQSASEVKHKLLELRAAQSQARHDDGIKPRRPDVDRALKAVTPNKLKEVLNVGVN